MSRRLLRMAAAAVVLAASVAGCSGTHAVSQSVTNGIGYSQGDESLTWIPDGRRPAVTGVSGELLDGTHFDLSQWRGHVVVVNFWGSWCGPCQLEARALEQVHRDTESDGVRFLGVNVRDNLPLARSFESDHHVTYPSLFDPSNLVALKFTGMPPSATPSTIVIDRTGHIAARHSGGILYTQLRSVVDRVRAESAGT